MNLLPMFLAEAGEVREPWLAGVRVSTIGGHPWEALELLMIFTVFIGVLAAVYFIQKWIGDY